MPLDPLALDLVPDPDNDARRTPRVIGPATALLLLTGGLASLAGCGGGAGEPERWQCRNPVEVQCTAGECEVGTGEDFTPLDVRFDSAGAIRVCAYSGCWEGDGRVASDGAFVVVTSGELPFSGPARSGHAGEEVAIVLERSVAIVLERSDGLGVLKVGSFATPIACSSEPL